MEKYITRTFWETTAEYRVMQGGALGESIAITIPGRLTRSDVVAYLVEQYPDAETVVVSPTVETKPTVYGMTLDAFRTSAVPVDRPPSQQPKATPKKSKKQEG